MGLDRDSAEVISNLIEVLLDDVAEEMLVSIDSSSYDDQLGSPEFISASIIALRNTKKKEEEIRMAAITLSELGVDLNKILARLTDLLECSLYHNCWRDRSAAADALGRLGIASDEVITALVDSLQNDREWLKVRLSAASALGRLGRASEEVVKVLINVLGNTEDEDLRNWTVHSLVLAGDGSSELIAVLVDILQPDPQSERAAFLRRYASEALFRMFRRSERRLDFSEVLHYVRQILGRMKRSDYILDPWAALPLFGVWQAYRTNGNNFILTWNLLELELDKEDNGV